MKFLANFKFIKPIHFVPNHALFLQPLGYRAASPDYLLPLSHLIPCRMILCAVQFSHHYLYSEPKYVSGCSSGFYQMIIPWYPKCFLPLTHGISVVVWYISRLKLSDFKIWIMSDLFCISCASWFYLSPLRLPFSVFVLTLFLSSCRKTPVFDFKKVSDSVLHTLRKTEYILVYEPWP